MKHIVGPFFIRGFNIKLVAEFGRLKVDIVESGELDDCDLTLKDLHQIEESFVRVLMGIFHRRIAYPEKETEVRAT